jgi:hypothetical protein
MLSLDTDLFVNDSWVALGGGEGKEGVIWIYPILGSGACRIVD